MSSDTITPVHGMESARLQGMHTTSTATDTHKTQPLQGKESAARGQNLPVPAAEVSGLPTGVDKIEAAVSQISDFVQNFQRDLQFSVDKRQARRQSC
jgi:uncharacterized FlaG/YvyC family protein